MAPPAVAPVPRARPERRPEVGWSNRYDLRSPKPPAEQPLPVVAEPVAPEPPAEPPQGQEQGQEAPPAEPPVGEVVEEPAEQSAEAEPPANPEREQLWASTWAAATAKQANGGQAGVKPPAERRAELRAIEQMIAAGGVFAPDLPRRPLAKNLLPDPRLLDELLHPR